MGLSVAVVAGQRAEAVAAYLKANPLPFPFLIDPDRQVIKAYGVHHLIGLDAFNMARPASFFIDRQGVVQFLHVSSNQFERPAPEQLLAAAKWLQVD